MRKLTDEKISEIVHNIARQYGKDVIKGTGFSFETFEEYRQELFIKAYELLSVTPTLDENYLYKCLWNKATDVFRSLSKISYNEVSYEKDYDYDQQENYLYDNSEVFRNTVEVSLDDSETDKVLNKVMKLLKSQPASVRKFVVSKLVVEGYLMNNTEDVNIDLDKLSNDDRTVDAFILEEVLGYKNGRTGGPGSFKSFKSKFKEDLIDQLELLDVVKKRYEVVLERNGEYKTVFVKDYNDSKIIKRYEDEYTIVSIVME